MWFLDHNYLENMTAMCRKVNGASITAPESVAIYSLIASLVLLCTIISFETLGRENLGINSTNVTIGRSYCFILFYITAREHIVGWYHTGPKLHPNDIAIHELIGKYRPNPVSIFMLHSIKSGSF